MVFMYVPKHFAAPSDAAVHELLSRAAACDLVTWDGQGMVATTLPLLFDPAAGVLSGHVARNNTQWQHTGSEALTIVRGPDAYVSPSAYASKREHGRVVPTWNYITAHVYGTLVAHDDPAWTEDLVRRLTERHEAGRPSPWSVADAPRAFIEGQLRAIVGIELVITRVEAKWKLSQNRSAEDIAGVRDDLRADHRGSETERQVAAAMDVF
ncbi:FMN-binding negative transcriptional regulator [Dactylosporangium siamense]|uniref:Transcriptional regulator n=2 Tax=Dactylosporangium siamense TaxID=685454 RepID=A0A919UDC8_9ACTN|nr:transcriptional regulator [Dactylosporangium siamense]